MCSHLALRYAGAGIYTTVQAEYAALYSDMSGSKTMILCVVAVSNVYPISRSADYAPPLDTAYFAPGRRSAGHSKFYAGTGAALKPGFDAHWFTVTPARLCDTRSGGTSGLSPSVLIQMMESAESSLKFSASK